MLKTNNTALKSRPARSDSTDIGPTGIGSEAQHARPPIRSVEPISNRPHSVIYKAIAGLALWFVVSAWLFFGGAVHMGLILAIVCMLFIMAMGVPYILWRAGESARGSETTAAAPPTETFGAWIRRDFATSTGNQTSVTATVEILLPIAAVAIGITALGFVWTAAQ